MYPPPVVMETIDVITVYFGLMSDIVVFYPEEKKKKKKVRAYHSFFISFPTHVSVTGSLLKVSTADNDAKYIL